MDINMGLDRSKPPRPPSPDRQANGKFAPGNQLAAGIGRPTRDREQAAIAALRRAATDADLDAIASDIVASARRGNWKAIRFLFEYLVGKPTIRVDSTRTEQGALWVFIQQIQAGQVIDAVPGTADEDSG